VEDRRQSAGRGRLGRADSGFAGGAVAARVGHAGFFRVLVELEIAFRFAEAIEPRGRAYARDEVLSKVGVVLPTIEIVDSRFAEWPNVAPLAQLADAQNNGALITGHPVAYAGLARGFDFVSPELELSFDGDSLVPEPPATRPAIRANCWCGSSTIAPPWASPSSRNGRYHRFVRRCAQCGQTGHCARAHRRSWGSGD
jgi:2-keto-4-pentenoate hydratase